MRPFKLKSIITAAVLTLVMALSVWTVAGRTGAFGSTTHTDTFSGSIVLSRPEPSAMTANILASQASRVYLVWREAGSQSVAKTTEATCTATVPAVITMKGLEPGHRYAYSLWFKGAADETYQHTREYSFCTPKKAGSSYSFVMQSDSHLLNKADPELYSQSMNTAASWIPDFIIDLGDTFLNDQRQDWKNPDLETVRQIYLQQRKYFDIVTRSAPLFQVIGNHEGEYGSFLDGTDKNLAIVSARMRKLYYPNPVQDTYYTGNSVKDQFLGQVEDYYSYQWGDALFVVIDPYRYSTADPNGGKDGWQWSLGKNQYDWFRKTLETSQAKYKFVFAHHAIGNIRGGSAVAKLYEWGGYERNGQYLFDKYRPGWGKPIQQVMKDTGVTIFFQGHDHLFAREDVDGVIYQTLPKPAEKVADKQLHSEAYGSNDRLLNSGILKVDVSPARVTVSYYRNYFVSTAAQTGNTGFVYSYSVDPAHKVTVLKSTKDDFATYGGALGAQ